MELWQINEQISNDAVDRLTKGISRVEDEIYAIMRRYLLRFNLEDGTFAAQTATATLITEMNREIAAAVAKSSLDSEISKFLVNFDQIGENVKAMHQQLSDVTVPNRIINQQKQLAIDSTVYSLKTANVDMRFIDPIKRVLFQRVTTGASLIETERELRRLIQGGDGNKGMMERWVGQIARDSINQYEGTIHTAVKNEFGFTAIRYVNSLVEDSRAQCQRWVGMGRIEEKDLPAEIQWAYNNGSGMIPATFTDNFLINRGGYNCRHRAIPVK
jgi:hypothetical protein